MANKLDELKQRAERAARELDEKYNIKSRVTEGARSATDAVRKGAETARDEVSKFDREHGISKKVSDGAKRVADAAGDVLRDSGALNKAEEVAGAAKTKASDLFGDARNYYNTASGTARAGTSAARLPSSIISALSRGRTWMKQNPGKAAIVSLSFVAGIRAGAAFSSLDVALLGAGGAGNWIFHSAVVPWGMRKLSEKYKAYLERQEVLIREGKMSEADVSRIEFERNVAKYVGAPLLGAFSIAAGVGLISEAVTGGVVTGAPISLVLGGNPLLSSIWLFGNGLICIHNGYKFFMMALADQDQVQRVVRDIKGLLPVTTENTAI